MKRRVLTLCLACVFLLGLLPTAALAVEYQHGGLTVQTGDPDNYTLTPESEGSEISNLVIHSGAYITLSGDGSKFNISVEENAQNVVITLDGFSTDRNPHKEWGCGIVLKKGSSVTMALVGENSICAGRENCAIEVSETASLTIDGEGVLNASINNGSSAAYCAVIGSRYTMACGNITINGGTINAYSASSSAAAIGTALWQGKEGACGTIALNGGVINANIIGSVSRQDAVVTGSGGAVVNTDRLQADFSGFNGIMWNGKNGTVCGNVVSDGFAVEAGKVLTVPDGATLVIPQNETLIINGTIILKGTIENNGVVTGQGKIIADGGSMSGGVSDITPVPCTHEAAAFVSVDENSHKKVCLICGKELGEEPHGAGDFCPDCGYGADPIGENAFYTYDAEAKAVQIYGVGALWDRESSYDHYGDLRKWREISYEMASVVISPYITAVNDAFRDCYHLETVCAPEGLEIETDPRVTKLTYSMTGDGAVIKSITLGDGKDGVTLPAELNGKPVTAHPHIGGGATCSRPGVCAACAQQYTLPHTAGEWIIDQEATDISAGSKHKECTVCGYVMETEAIPATGQPGGSDVPYLFCDTDGANWQTGKKNSGDCITVTARTIAWSAGWYVASGDVTIDSRVTVTGKVHLILEDGCKLTVNGGIGVGDGSGLTVYAQTTGDNMGVLTAATASGNAGIGGGGSVTINGGTVKTTGGMGSKGWGGAGIGGGIRSSGGSITINGGNVTAAGNGTGAGIGNGTGGSGSTVTINGGTVNATGGIDYDYSSGGGAGIGGSENDTVIIRGGTVNAKGGEGGASYGGAGIGGNPGYTAGTITISGGIVTAIGGGVSAGIGGGSLTGNGGNVTISGGTVTATSNGGAGIGAAAGGDTQGAFSTETNGNALIVASSIGDNDDKSGWSGVIFEGDSGVIYGASVTLATDGTIPSGKTLEIGENQTLTIGAGTTLTVDGTLEIAGGGTLDISDGGRLVVGNGGKVIVLENGIVKVGDTTVTLPDGGTVDDDGKITVPEGGTIQIGTDPVTTITPPNGGEVTPDGNGGVTVPDGSKVQTGDGPEIIVGGQGGTIGSDGSIIVPEGGTVTVKDDSGNTTVTMPGGGTVKPKTDGTVEVSGGATVEKGGQTTTVPDGGGTLDPATGKVTQGGGSGSSGGSYTPPSKPSVPVVTVEQFTDVAPGAWYYDAVKYAVDHGLFYGISDTIFSPDSAMTRGMLATVLYRMENEPEADPADFLDVGSGKYYSEAVAWAAANGIVEGYGNGNFGPEDAITREQLAAILYRYSGSPTATGTLDRFTDADKASGYALDALRWAIEQGIIQGKGNGILDPGGRATRAEVAAMLMRYCETAKR